MHCSCGSDFSVAQIGLSYQERYPIHTIRSYPFSSTPWFELVFMLLVSPLDYINLNYCGSLFIYHNGRLLQVYYLSTRWTDPRGHWWFPLYPKAQAEWQSLQRIMKRARRCTDPSPCNHKNQRTDYVLQEKAKTTVDNQNFLIHDDPGSENSVICWGTRRNLDKTRWWVRLYDPHWRVFWEDVPRTRCVLCNVILKTWARCPT